MKLEDLQHIVSSIAGPYDTSSRPSRLEQQLTALQAQENVFGVSVFAGDWNLLRETCQTIDQEQDPKHAWRMVHSIVNYCVKTFPEQMKAAHAAVSANVEKSTVLYFDRIPRAGKKWNPASGTLIEIDGRLFIATTSHSIPPKNADGRLVLVPHRFVGETDVTVQILDVAWDEDETNDVAFLEVHVGAPAVLQKSPISLERIDLSDTGRPAHSVLLCGYPFALGKSFQVQPLFSDPRISVPVGAAKFQIMSSMNQFVRPEDWHLLPIPAGSPKPDLRRDVFFPWPDGPDEVTCSDPNLDDILCNPSGMSGGGYWHRAGSSAEGIWSPEKFCLTAIQNGWWEPGRYVRGTQIIHWLRLVWSRKPELRRTLERAFPNHDLQSAE